MVDRAGRCEECGFDWDAGTPAEIASSVRDLARRFGPPLTRFIPTDDPDAVLRARPEPDVWSALEYAGHTRDALRFYEGRISAVMSEDRPQLAPWNHREVAERERYNDADRVEVANGLVAAAVSLADALEGIDEPDWMRVGIGVDGDERTVLVLARRALHEGNHHLLDIGRSLRAARSNR